MRRAVLVTAATALLAGCSNLNWEETGRAFLKSVCFEYSNVSCDEERATRRS